MYGNFDQLFSFGYYDINKYKKIKQIYKTMKITNVKTK